VGVVAREVLNQIGGRMEITTAIISFGWDAR
jgi:hypothetical protein